MTLIDSKAAFRQRCGELSTASISFFELLAAQNINSFSELAFLSGTRPPSDEEFKALSDSVLGGGASAGQIGLLRRLHFKATTLVLSHLKTAVTSETSEDIGKHPFAEKQVFAGSSNLTIEIRKANLRGLAVGKSVGRAPRPYYRLGFDSGGRRCLLSEFIRQEASNTW